MARELRSPLRAVADARGEISLPNPVSGLRSGDTSTSILPPAHQFGSTCVGSFLPTMFLNRTT